MIRTLSYTITALLLSLTGAVSSASATDIPQPARAFITSHCTECHDADSKKGGLDLTTLPANLDDPALEARWTLVHDRVQRGEMPPKKATPPPPAARGAFLQSLGGFLTEHDAARQAVGGRVVLRRLNRVEYENTVHDLLKIDVPLADMLPEDATADGFDNVSDALRLSVTQIDSYLKAADKALDAAINLERDPRINLRFSMLDMPQIKDLLDRPHGMTTPNGTKFERCFDEKDGAFLLYQNETFGPTLMRQARSEYTGKYRVRVSMFPHQNTGHPVVVARWMVNDFFRNRTLANLDLIPGQPREAEFTVWIEKGWMLTISATGLTEVAPDGTKLRQVGADKFKGPGIGVRWVEFQGPLVDTWPPPSVNCVFGDVPVKLLKKMRGQRAYELAPANVAEDADKAVMSFATRAFRRPVSSEDVSRYLRLTHEALDQGGSFESAVRRACKAILTSPQFLFLQESRGRLDDYALASRLSYFLWSSGPDDELLKLAAQGKLHDPAALRAQTDRLLASPRAHAFTKNFCGQWLNLRAIDATMPDQRVYPEYDGLLKDAMVGETEAFFDEMLRSDLPVKTLIDSDFAMLNRRLAEHYGIPGVQGEQFRKVPLPPDSHRGGILTQASILKVTANGTTTSPVVRGAWVVRRILGRALQPPPPNAGSIEPDTRGATTIREQLDKHRHMASCSVCHQYMDPPGFALESYDVIGGWRPWYRVQGTAPVVAMEDRTTCKAFNVRKGPLVDPSGQLPDGRKFADIDHLKKMLLDQQEGIARNLTNNLITYATGAGVTFADRGAVDEILKKAERGGYGLRTLVHEVVESRLFQNK
jgi:mono/diheme cytochrome c family protein